MCTVPRDQKRASDPETGVTDGCEQPYQCWESNLVLLEEQSMFLTPEPSLQPLCHFVQWCWHFHKLAVMTALPPASTHRLQTLRGDPLLLGWYVFSLMKVPYVIIWEVHAVCSDNICLPPLP